MKYLILVVKGVVYGITHVVPGLGGGLILILMGIYEQFVESIGNLFIRRDRWKEYLSFLIPLGIGMMLGVVLLAKLIDTVYERYPAAMMFFFMGLLLGTIPYVLKLHDDLHPSAGRFVAGAGGVALVVLMKLLSPAEDGVFTIAAMSEARGFLYNLGVCFMAGGASVTPGLDGSYVLLLGGTYEPLIEALGQLADLVIHWGPLVSLGLGAGLGILAFSKLIDTLIKRAPAVAYYGILGLILGSVYGLWPTTPAQTSLAVRIVAFALGFVVALFFSREPIEEPAG